MMQISGSSLYRELQTRLFTGFEVTVSPSGNEKRQSFVKHYLYFGENIP